jgi:ribosome-associated toxin RatA of RatAB toxin-antitoxin module
MFATIDIRYRGIEQSFSTLNAMEPDRRIDMALREGPFSRLTGQWLFTPLGEIGSKIEFRLEYTFSSAVLEKLVGPAFGHIASSMVESFTKRADEVYR